MPHPPLSEKYNERIYKLFDGNMRSSKAIFRKALQSRIGVLEGRNYRGRITLHNETRTTDIFANFYKIGSKKYADVITVLYSERKHYIPKKLFSQHYLKSAVKRTVKTVMRLRANGYSVRSSLIVLVGNFSRNCISIVKDIREFKEFGLKTSVRVLPIKPVRYHRVGKYVIDSAKKAIAVLLYWISRWFVERTLGIDGLINRKSKEEGSNPSELRRNNPLLEYLARLTAKIQGIMTTMFGKETFRLIEVGGGANG